MVAIWRSICIYPCVKKGINQSARRNEVRWPQTAFRPFQHITQCSVTALAADPGRPAMGRPRCPGAGGLLRRLPARAQPVLLGHAHREHGAAGACPPQLQRYRRTLHCADAAAHVFILVRKRAPFWLTACVHVCVSLMHECSCR